jgi:hypothetical protein
VKKKFEMMSRIQVTLSSNALMEVFSGTEKNFACRSMSVMMHINVESKQPQTNHLL